MNGEIEVDAQGSGAPVASLTGDWLWRRHLATFERTWTAWKEQGGGGEWDGVEGARGGGSEGWGVGNNGQAGLVVCVLREAVEAFLSSDFPVTCLGT